MSQRYIISNLRWQHRHIRGNTLSSGKTVEGVSQTRCVRNMKRDNKKEAYRRRYARNVQSDERTEWRGGRRVSASFYFVSFRKASLRFVFELFHLSHVWARVFSEGCVTLRSGDNNRRNFYAFRDSQEVTSSAATFLVDEAALAIFQVSLPAAGWCSHGEKFSPRNRACWWHSFRELRKWND